MLFLTAQPGEVNAQWFKWAESVGFSGQNTAEDIIVDQNNNVYVLGAFDDSLFMNNFHYSTLGSRDLFLSKYDSSGQEIWTRHLGSTGLDAARTLAFDQSGNVVLAGSYENILYSYSWNDSLRTATNKNLFTARVSPLGNLVSFQRLAWSDGDAVVHDIAIDSENNLYVTGYFTDSITFSDSAYRSYAKWDIFISKYDSLGNGIWSRRCGGTDQSSFGDYGFAIDVDSSDHVYIAGIFRDTSDFFGTRLISNNASNDIYVLKLDTAGSLIWLKQFGDSRHDQCRDMLIDKNHIVLTGNFWSSLTINNTVNSTGQYDIYIAKLDLNGNPLWITSAGGPRWDDSDRVSVDLQGNLYITGYFIDSASLWGIPVKSWGAFEPYVAKFDMNGNFQWVEVLAGNGFDRATGISVDKSGEIYLSGFFSDSLAVGKDTLKSNGGWEAYFARLSQTPPTIQNHLREADISIFPNPTKDQISLLGPELEKVLAIEIYAPDGRLSQRYSPTSVSSQNISIGQAPGIYIVKLLYSKDEHLIHRIVKLP